VSYAHSCKSTVLGAAFLAGVAIAANADPTRPVRLDGRQRRERFPIARPRSRGSPALHCDAGPKQRNTAGDQELQNRTTCRSSGVSAGLFWYPWDELIRIERVGSLALSGRTYNRCKATRLTHSGPSGAPARLSPSIRSVAYR
jgi:hypothetical protein